jgi:hypothetical protein
MRYVTMTFAVSDETVSADTFESKLDNAVHSFDPAGFMTQYDVSTEDNEMWLFGGDRIETGAKE